MIGSLSDKDIFGDSSIFLFFYSEWLNEDKEEDRFQMKILWPFGVEWGE